mmetsp:Transcript_1040/g.2882  ORF Transcript_1040/g.2882 Transcript_1040/m.2882 type:complete len:104 (+) Transcript_1040:26-337(+)
MDYLLSRFENGARWLWLLELLLDAAAASRQVFGLVPERVKVVPSRATNPALIHHYATAQTYICCGRSGAGKTMAAMYLLQGRLHAATKAWYSCSSQRQARFCS